MSFALHILFAVGCVLLWTAEERAPRQATRVKVRPTVPELRDEPPPTVVPPPEIDRADDAVEFRAEESVDAGDDPHLAAPSAWTGPRGVGVLSEFADCRLGPRRRRPVVEHSPPVPAARSRGLDAESAPGAVARVPADEPSPPTFTAARARADNAPPSYPERALLRGWTGVVVLDLHVAADGAVHRVEVVEGSGHRALDLAATRAARSWRFAPARRGDQPVESVVRRRVRFAL